MSCSQEISISDQCCCTFLGNVYPSIIVILKVDSNNSHPWPLTTIRSISIHYTSLSSINRQATFDAFICDVVGDIRRTTIEAVSRQYTRSTMFADRWRRLTFIYFWTFTIFVHRMTWKTLNWKQNIVVFMKMSYHMSLIQVNNFSRSNLVYLTLISILWRWNAFTKWPTNVLLLCTNISWNTTIVLGLT